MQLSLPYREKIAVSFSGGRSSAVMTKLVWDLWADTANVSITFANTGREHPATLDFVHECETRFGWPVVWLEAVVDTKEGKGVRHKIVDYETASRNGEPFEAAIAKYGIFNQTSPSCTTRLKENVMDSYRKSIGFRFGKHRNHDTCIGIRSDEVDRISSKRKEYRLAYPLVANGITKRDVALEIRKWGFDLGLPGDHYGNCKTCWKKTLRKLLTIAKESPDCFDWDREMERKYGHVKAGPEYKATAPDGRRYFHRGHMSAEELVQLAHTKDFAPYTDDPHDHAKDVPFDDELDRGSGCGESCEVYADY